MEEINENNIGNVENTENINNSKKLISSAIDETKQRVTTSRIEKQTRDMIEAKEVVKENNEIDENISNVPDSKVVNVSSKAMLSSAIKEAETRVTTTAIKNSTTNIVMAEKERMNEKNGKDISR